MSPQARAALDWSETVIGYKTYLEQIEPLLAGRRVLASGMTKEMDRAGQALELALNGVRTAVVSGGDPGVYGMAGVVLETARARGLILGPEPDQVLIEVIPGLPALAAAAALLGAPLAHDFACVSLSDRLTPWETIARRLDLAAAADFVLVLYNPKSRGRDWQFQEACRIAARHRPPATPVGLVSRAMRPGESLTLTTLERAPEAEVDMRTLAIIGNSRSYVYQSKMITPRGYLDKYQTPVR
ncbi:MAG: precorrin-3B C(17)-methyltransferase [Thermodesulfobacteriota bacterium]